MDKKTYHVVSLSGGKDSTAMLLRMVDEGWPIDEVLFCDTGLEFPAMYKHIDKVEEYIGMPITRLKADHSFEYYMLEHTPKRRSEALQGKVGLSWPGPKKRWCTSLLKTSVINRHLAALGMGYDIIQYIGIAADEPKRVREKRYPLVEWGMTEEDCLRYCKERGFDWDGLYDIFRRVSCWCCPLQRYDELRKLRKHFPELWQQLKDWDQQTWRSYLKRYSVEQLETRFAFEDECLKNGIPIKGKAFFTALREKLEEVDV